MMKYYRIVYTSKDNPQYYMTGNGNTLVKYNTENFVFEETMSTYELIAHILIEVTEYEFHETIKNLKNRRLIEKLKR